MSNFLLLGEDKTMLAVQLYGAMSSGIREVKYFCFFFEFSNFFFFFFQKQCLNIFVF